MVRGIEAVWGWLEANPLRALVICLVFAAAQRLPFVNTPLQSDEGGFLMVAGQWHGRGDALYTDQWVDRPPLLLLTFKAAYLLGGDGVTLRLMSLAFGSAVIGAAWWAGRTINGSRGAVSAAIVAASISSCYTMDGFALTGETIASAYVMTSCALVIEATYGHRSTRIRILLALAAGILASLAFLTKQNFIEAGLFSAVLLGLRRRETWRLIAAGLAGIAIPLCITIVWARSPEGPGLSQLWVALFEFRQQSLSVIEGAGLAEPLQRLKWLVFLFFASGVFFLVCQLFIAAGKAGDRHSLRVALVVMVAYVVVSILVGASWWTHYLLQLGPVLAMGAALATRDHRAWLGGHAAASYTAIASTVVALFAVPSVASGRSDGMGDAIIGEYVHAASHAGDSIVVAYGAPNVIQLSGLTTPYEYSWSLPLRTRDPHLRQLVGVLNGGDAPTWLVEISDFDWWGIDTPQFQLARATRYRVVATVCGHDIYLRDGLGRALPPTPPC